MSAADDLLKKIDDLGVTSEHARTLAIMSIAYSLRELLEAVQGIDGLIEHVANHGLPK